MAANQVPVGLGGWMKKQSSSAYLALERFTHGGFSLLVETGRRFGKVRASEAAASLAFYSVFSIIPLLALLVVAVSLFVPRDQIVSRLDLLLSPVFPSSFTFISASLQRLIRLRSAFGMASVVGLIWSASNVFAILVNHISLAWEHARQRSYLQNRLFALGLTGALIGLLAILGLLAGMFGFLLQLRLPILGDQLLTQTSVWNGLLTIVPAVVIFCLYLTIYTWVPNTRVSLRDTGWAALAAALGWSAVTVLFGAYLKLGFGPSHFLYGSLSTIVMLMLWVYINSLILLFGAHLSAMIERRRRLLRDLEMHAQSVGPAIPDPPDFR
jgi:membrane protein